jgi:hypothetical protein
MWSRDSFDIPIVGQLIMNSSRFIGTDGLWSCWIWGSHFLRWYLARLIRPWRWRLYLPPKRRFTSSGLHGVMCCLLPYSKELDPNLRNLDLIHIITPSFPMIHFVIILSFLSRFSKWFLSFVLSNQYFLYIYYLLDACHMSRPFHSPD